MTKPTETDSSSEQSSSDQQLAQEFLKQLAKFLAREHVRRCRHKRNGDSSPEGVGGTGQPKP